MVSVDLFRVQGAEVIAVTDSEGTSGPAHVERLLRGLIADGRCDAFFTCGSSRLLARAAPAGAGVRHFGPGRAWSSRWPAASAVLLLRAGLQGRRRDRSSPGVLGRAGVRHDGGACDDRSLCACRRLTLANPGDAGLGHVRRRARHRRSTSTGWAPSSPRRSRASCAPAIRCRGWSERPGGLINSIGIPSKGVPYFLDHTLPYYASYQPPWCVSISAPTAEGFAQSRRGIDPAGDCRDRSQHFLPEYRGRRQGIRACGRPPPRPSSGSCAPRRRCRSGSSSRPTPAIFLRSPARRRRPAPMRSWWRTPSWRWQSICRRSSRASAMSWAGCRGRRSSRSCCGRSINARAR